MKTFALVLTLTAVSGVVVLTHPAEACYGCRPGSR